MADKIELPNIDDFIEKYRAGISMKQLADEAGVARHCLKRQFLAAGVEVRGRSEAETAKWKTMDRAAIERQLSRAWESRRGSTDSAETKAARALTKFRKQLHIHRLEPEVASLLRAAGYSVSTQLPIGSYNLDLAIEKLSIAVEVVHIGASDFNGRAGTKNRPQYERLKYLLDLGWHVVFLIGTGNPKTIRLAVVGDDLLAAVKFASKNPAARGKYRVIWGHGEPSSRAQYDFHGLPAIR